MTPGDGYFDVNDDLPPYPPVPLSVTLKNGGEVYSCISTRQVSGILGAASVLSWVLLLSKAPIQAML
jgi:hypothetical protein